MPIDQRLKENGYIEAAFLHQGLPIKLIADICICTEEEIEEHLRQVLVDKDEHIKRSFVEAAIEKACQDAKVFGAESVLYFLANVLGKQRPLTKAEQDHALTLKLPKGFEPEPE